MADLNVTRWSPDTCGCVLEYSWDPAVPEDARVHTPHGVIRACPGHTGMGMKAVHQAVTAENQSKNRMVAAVVEHVPRLRKPVDDGFTIADGVEVAWRFAGQGASRALTIEFPGANLTPPEKAQLRVVAATMAVPTTVA